MKLAPFSYYHVDCVISEESASHGDYASEDATETADADLREALALLDSDCWDNVDMSGDGSIVCYPADFAQNYCTGDYEASQLIITARRPEWAERLLDVWSARKRR